METKKPAEIVYEKTSQYGECHILDLHFKNDHPGYFVDIGAADGLKHSNTYSLIRNGWSGILVEPCKHFLEELENRFSKNDKVSIFPGAISDYVGTTNLHVWQHGNDSQISTIVKKQYNGIRNDEWWQKKGSFTDKYLVDITTPSDLLKKYKSPKYINFVDIDAEASEMQILNKWPWDEYEVELFCIETSPGVEVLENFMLQKNYVNWIQTGGNIFFCKKKSAQSEKFKKSIDVIEKSRFSARIDHPFEISIQPWLKK